MSREARMVSELPECRASAAENTIEGYGVIYNVETVIGGMFREVIRPGAFRSVLSGKSTIDVRSAFNHLPEYVLGRTSNGTLKLIDDERGLRYITTINPEDSQAMSVRAKIMRRDVTGSSFAFTVAPKGDRMVPPSTRGDLPLREITEIEALYEIGPVTFPAYEETTTEARDMARAAAQAMEMVAQPVDDTWQIEIGQSRERCRLIDATTR